MYSSERQGSVLLRNLTTVNTKVFFPVGVHTVNMKPFQIIYFYILLIYYFIIIKKNMMALILLVCLWGAWSLGSSGLGLEVKGSVVGLDLEVEGCGMGLDLALGFWYSGKRQ